MVKTEANAKVQIKDADGKVIGSGTADAQGEFSNYTFTCF